MEPLKGLSKGMTAHWRQGCGVIDVDVHKATFKGYKLWQLGAWGRRKFENVLFLNNPRERVKFIYH